MVELIQFKNIYIYLRVLLMLQTKYWREDQTQGDIFIFFDLIFIFIFDFLI